MTTEAAPERPDGSGNYQVTYRSIVHMVDPETGQHENAPIRWMYTTVDPFAVSLVFVATQSGEVDIVWTFAREVLFTGFYGDRAGEHGVRISPSPNPSDTNIRVIRLESGDGVLYLMVPRPLVQRFLTETYRVCPEGTESDRVDVDSWIDRIMTEGSPDA